VRELAAALPDELAADALRWRAGGDGGDGVGGDGGAGDGGGTAGQGGPGAQRGDGAGDGGGTAGDGDGQAAGRDGGSDAAAALRAEAARYRRELRAAQTRVQELEAASLSDTERLQRENQTLTARTQELERAARTATLRYEAAVLAQRLHVVDVDAAVRLLPELQWDDDGHPVGLEAAMQELTAARPWLVSNGTGGVSGGAVANAARGGAAGAGGQGSGGDGSAQVPGPLGTLIDAYARSGSSS
jgi:hypothetical protein